MEDSINKEQLDRTRLMFSETGDASETLANLHVVIVGLGGVGSHAFHSMLRSGVRKWTVIDGDYVTLSSLNRHSWACRSDVGRLKVDLAQDLAVRIWGTAQITRIPHFVMLDDETPLTIPEKVDLVLDCIDQTTSKFRLLQWAHVRGIPVWSALGCGAKCSPFGVRWSESLWTVSGDGLATQLKEEYRRQLRQALEAQGKSAESVEYDPSLTNPWPLCRFVWSEEKPAIGLCDPLDVKTDLAQYSATSVADASFRVRRLPVWEPLPAIFGHTLSAMALLQLLQRPLPGPGTTSCNEQEVWREAVQFYTDAARRGKFPETQVGIAERYPCWEAIHQLHSVQDCRCAGTGALLPVKHAILRFPNRESFKLQAYDRRWWRKPKNQDNLPEWSGIDSVPDPFGLRSTNKRYASAASLDEASSTPVTIHRETPSSSSCSSSFSSCSSSSSSSSCSSSSSLSLLSTNTRDNKPPTAFGIRTLAPSPQAAVPQALEPEPSDGFYLLKEFSQLVGANIFAKQEFSATHTSKRRSALAIIEDAENKGLIERDSEWTLYEGSSGNMGVELARAGAQLGYKVHVCLEEDQSPYKIQMLRDLGAFVTLMPRVAASHPRYFATYAQTMALADKKGYFCNQFHNFASAMIHEHATGPEILQGFQKFCRENNLQGHQKLDAVVVGAGTGATICGLSRFFSQSAHICLADIPGSGLANYVNHGVCWDPSESVTLSGSRRSWVDGIGQNRLTELFRSAKITSAEQVPDDASRAMVRWMHLHEGLAVGPSSAVNLCAARQLLSKLPPLPTTTASTTSETTAAASASTTRFFNVVVILHDSATLYPSCQGLLGSETRNDTA